MLSQQLPGWKRNTTEILNKDYRSADRHLKSVTPEYKAESQPSIVTFDPKHWRKKKSSYYNAAFQKQYGKSEVHSKLRKIWRWQQQRLLYELTANRKIDVRFHMSRDFCYSSSEDALQSREQVVCPVPSGISLRLSRNLFIGSPETLSQAVASGNRSHTSVWTRKPSYVLLYEMRISSELLLRRTRNLIPYRPRAFSGSLFANPGDFFLLSK
jgi:hypothetical protein